MSTYIYIYIYTYISIYTQIHICIHIYKYISNDSNEPMSIYQFLGDCPQAGLVTGVQLQEIVQRKRQATGQEPRPLSGDPKAGTRNGNDMSQCLIVDNPGILMYIPSGNLSHSC